MSLSKNLNEKQVDIVITWVDGDDPLLKEKRDGF
ncbi:Stealth CR1 domain-containing protein, partial [uncultured Psychrobacter sp.]